MLNLHAFLTIPYSITNFSLKQMWMQNENLNSVFLIIFRHIEIMCAANMNVTNVSRNQ